MSDISIDQLVVVAIGGNLPGPEGSIEDALESALNQFKSSELKIAKRSRWWRSRSWPDGTAPDYINGVVIVETLLDAPDTLARLTAIEVLFGRTRSEPNAPRCLDLDLIAFGRTRLQTSSLTLPHPRANERLFVMGPLAEIAPDWRCPVSGRRASELARLARVGRDAHPI